MPREINAKYFAIYAIVYDCQKSEFNRTAAC